MEGIYEVHPPMTREDMAKMRQECKMEPATFNYSDPTTEMRSNPLWEAIWNEIKTWDINVPTEYGGYCGATGNHVSAIYLAIKAATDNDYVAWMRWAGDSNHRHLALCDSDAEGAFKVYRKP